jgi:hypothetical protein
VDSSSDFCVEPITDETPSLDVQVEGSGDVLAGDLPASQAAVALHGIGENKHDD